MACSLKLNPAADSDFVGKVGDSVTIKLVSTDDPNAVIVNVRYAGQVVTGPPYTFVIQLGANQPNKRLVVLVESMVPGAALELREDCGDGTDQLLDSFHYDPGNPAMGYTIKGV